MLLSSLIPILILTGLTPATGAQDPETRARLRLVSIPVAYELDDDLNVRVRVANEGEEPIDGFRLTVGAGALIVNRTTLESSFEGSLPALTSLTIDYLDLEIPPGQERTVALDTPVTDLLVGTVGDGGVHPLTLSLFSADDAITPLDTLSTQMMVYPSPPTEPLNLVTVLPLNGIPSRDPSGAFVADETGASGLEAAVAEDGWLRGIANALSDATAPGRRDDPPRGPLRLALAPTPRLIDELAAMADGFVRAEAPEEEIDEESPEATAAREVLELLRELTARPAIQPLLVPYAYPDLPSLEEELSAGDIGVQLTEAITVLDAQLEVELGRGWVFPPSGRVDDSSLQALQAAGVDEGVFFGADILESSGDPATSGCPEPSLSFVCQVRVETDVGPIGGYVADAGVQQRMGDFAQPGAGALEAQRILAETAMIHAEQPGIAGRVLQATVFAGWRPNPRIARALFEGLRDAPWLRTLTPEQGLRRAEPTIDRRVIADAPSPGALPDGTYFADVVAAQDVVQSFSTFIGEQEPRARLQRLRRNILVAEGRTLWDAGEIALAAGYATDSYDEATGEMSKVTLGVPSQTTFTSRTGTLDISIFNETGYPVEARLVLGALDMSFDPAVVDDTFPPGTSRLSVQAEAQSSGTFPIEVRIETADGYAVATQAVQVRSTEFNVVALAITFGAVAFLFLFYTIKAMRRRRARQDPAEVTGD